MNYSVWYIVSLLFDNKIVSAIQKLHFHCVSADRNDYGKVLKRSSLLVWVRREVISWSECILGGINKNAYRWGCPGCLTLRVFSHSVFFCSPPNQSKFDPWKLSVFMLLVTLASLYQICMSYVFLHKFKILIRYTLTSSTIIYFMKENIPSPVQALSPSLQLLYELVGMKIASTLS